MNELQDISLHALFVNSPEQRAANRQALFSFQGRVGRSMYWWFGCLPLTVFLFLTSLFDLHLRMGMAGFTIIGIILLWINLAVTTKRCHDRGKSGWFMLLSLVPILGLWVFVELGFLPGEKDSTRRELSENDSLLSPTPP